MSIRPPYLGFAVKVLGRPGLKSHDTRRWQSGPHLSVSLGYLRPLFAYLDQVDIRLYRLASGLAPYATHPDLPAFHHQVDECAAELADLGSLARRLRLRLSIHPSQYIVLNALDDGLAARSAADVELHATLLDAMGLDDEAVVVLHIGGAYDDRQAALERFVTRCEQLSPAARRRLVIENDDSRFSVPDLLWIHQRTGLRLVLDAHHHACHNPQGLALDEALEACLGTWRGWMARPKLHFSSPRPGGRPAAHADLVEPASFAAFYRLAARPSGAARPFGAAPDIILEAKLKDLAVLRLRQDLAAQAPDVAALLGLSLSIPGDEGGVGNAHL